ncbi:MAG: translocation/assembly module TamB domain-containing protein [bacterium]|jgi:translocation and assembly module TamB
MTWKNRIRKILKWFGIVLVGLILLLVILLGVIQTPLIKQQIARLAMNMINTSPAMNIRIEGLSGTIPYQMQVERIELSDPEGVWLTITNVSLNWAPHKILSSEFVIYDLTADQVQMLRKPAPPQPSAPREKKPFRLPDRLPSLRVDQLMVDEIHLASAVVGYEATYTLNGVLKPTGEEKGLQAQLNLEQVNRRESQVKLIAEVKGTPPMLVLHADVDDTQDGIFLALAGLENTGALTVDLHGEGPLEQWSGQLEAGIGNWGSVTSDVTIQATETFQVSARGTVQPVSGALPAQIDALLGERQLFDLNVAYAQGLLQLANSTVQTDTLALQVQGELGFENETVNASAELEADRLNILQPLLKQSIAGQAAIQATLSGTLDELQGQLSAQVNHPVIVNVSASSLDVLLEIPSFAIRNATFPTGHLILGATAEDVVLPAGFPVQERNLFIAADIQLHAIENIQVQPLIVRGENLNLSLQGTANARLPSASMQMELGVEELQNVLPHDIAGNARFSGMVQGGTSSLVAEMNGAIADLSNVPEFMKELAGTDIQLSASAAISQPTMFIIPHIRIHSQTASFISSASVNLEDKTILAQLNAEVEDIRHIATTDITGSVSLSGIVQGGTEFMTADLSGSLRNLNNIPGAAGVLAASDVQLKAAATLKDATMLNLSALSLQSRVASAIGSASVNLEDRTISSRITAHIKELKGILPSGITGQAEFTGVVEGGTPALEIDLRGTLSNLDNLPQELAGALGSKLDLSADATLRDTSKLNISALKAQSAAAALVSSASIDLAGKTLSGQYSLNLASLAPLQKQLGDNAQGKLRSQGKVQGAFDDLTLSASIEGNRISIRDYFIDDVSASLSARRENEAIQGSLELALTQQQRKLSASTGFSLEPPRITVSDLQIRAPQSVIEGELLYNMESRLMSGDVTGNLKDLSEIGRLLKQDLGGSLTFNAHLTAKEQQALVLNAEGYQIKTPYAQVDELNLRSDLNNVLQSPYGSMNLMLDSLRTKDLTLDEFTLTANGTQQAMFFESQGEGSWHNAFQYTANGNISRNANELTMGVNTFQGTFAGERILLNQPFSFSRTETQYFVRGLNANIGEANLRADGFLSNQMVQFDLSLNRLPLQLLEYAGVQDVQGILAAQVRVDGTPDFPLITARVEGQNMKILQPEAENIPSASLTMNADYRANRWAINATMTDLSEKPVQGDLNLPMNLSLQPFRVSFPEFQPMQGRIQGELNLSTLPALLLLEEQNLTGTVNASVEIAGTVKEPDLNGRFTLDNGTYDHYEQGIVLRDIQLNAQAQTHQLVVQQFSATDGGSGRLEGQGSVSLEGDKPVHVTLNMKQARLLRRDSVTATFNGTVGVIGSVTAPTINGNIIVGPAEIDIAQDFGSGGARELDIIEINGKADMSDTVEKREKAAQEPPDSSADQKNPVKFDLVVKAPGQVFVRGRGLDSEWRGDMKIGGNMSAPQISGSLSIIRGTFNFFGNMLDLTQGSLTFVGANPPEPFIDVVAETTRKDMTFRVRITGPVDEPEFELESDPMLPRDEILAHLLFGRRLTDITPVQALQLAQAAEQLSGGGNTFDVLGMTRDILGIDQLDIRQSEGTEDGDEGEASVGIGKYLTEDVYVDIEKGLGDESGKLSVEVKLTPNISLESELGMDSRAGVGVMWKYDY